MTQFWRPYSVCDVSECVDSGITDKYNFLNGNILNLTWSCWNRLGSQFPNSQSICVCDAGAFYLKVSNDDTDGEIVRYDLNTGNIIYSAVINDMGHGKVAYDKANDVLLITARKLGTDWSPKKVILLNPYTLQIVARVNTTFNMTFITTGVDGYIYGLCDFAHGKSIPFYKFIIKYNSETYTVEREYMNIDIPDYKVIAPEIDEGHEQGIAYDGENVYLLRAQPRLMYMYNTIDKTYRMYTLTGALSGYFYGEAEGISFYDGVLYFTSDHVAGNDHYLDMWKYPLTGGYISPTFIKEKTLRPSGYVYVDYATTSHTGNGASDNPFPCIEYAIYYINNFSEKVSQINIVNAPNFPIYLNGANNILIHNMSTNSLEIQGEAFNVVIYSTQPLYINTIGAAGATVKYIAGHTVVLQSNINRLNLYANADLASTSSITINSCYIFIPNGKSIASSIALGNSSVFRGER